MPMIDENYLTDVVCRRFSNPSNLNILCKDIPTSSRFTSEIFSSNDFYGNAEQIKRFLHLPSQYSLKAAIQHGNQYAGRHWDVEADSLLPVRLAWGTHIRDSWAKHSEKETHMISAPFFYSQGLLSAEDVDAEKKRLGRNLLLFPAHSNHNTTITFDVKFFLDSLQSFIKKFDSIRVCIYWKDYVLGLHKPYEDIGLECVTAGHIFDYNFLPRLRSLLEICDVSASNRIGSFFGYSIFLDRPHVFFDQSLRIIDHGIKRVEEDEVIWRDDCGVKKILEVFSSQDCIITNSHWDCLEPYFGFKEIKTASQLSHIFYRAEELYQKRELHKKNVLFPSSESNFEQNASDFSVKSEEANIGTPQPTLQESCRDHGFFSPGELNQLKAQLDLYRTSKVVQGALELKDIYITRTWNKLPSWCWRTIFFIGRKVLSGSKRAPFLNPLEPIENFLAAGDIDAAHEMACRLKGQASIPGLDAIRADIFLLKGDKSSAIQALREELRYFPSNKTARDHLQKLEAQLIPLRSENKELDALLCAIAPYTMVGSARLAALYENAKRICESSLSGNFVECGVAAGGTSGLLSAVLQRHDASAQKQLFSFDTFSGMPKPTDADIHRGQDAQASGWGEGTCAAPQESLLQLAQTLGTTHLIHPVKGFFADTLPAARRAIGPIALLHMDGDWYESTRDILVNLYDQLVPGAYIQVDDYGHWEGCRKALHDFFEARDIKIELHPIDGTGVWFYKPLEQQAKFWTGVEETIEAAAKKQFSSKVLVNLGSGTRWHPEWINIDFHGDGSNIFAHNLRLGVPLPDASVDCIYLSHCLEHFAPQEAEALLKACRKVLKPSGILRIVVPDLEQIARVYLASLDEARANPRDYKAAARHSWMIVELIDQLCRHQSGGEMLRLWAQEEVLAENFIISRVGAEYLNARKGCRGVKIPPAPAEPHQVGQFRLGGEPHQWMYDEQSLSRFLQLCGFQCIRKVDAVTSALEKFSSYNLDTNADGSVYKPDSLYMEGLACDGGLSCV